MNQANRLYFSFVSGKLPVSSTLINGNLACIPRRQESREERKYFLRICANFTDVRWYIDILKYAVRVLTVTSRWIIPRPNGSKKTLSPLLCMSLNFIKSYVDPCLAEMRNRNHRFLSRRENLANSVRSLSSLKVYVLALQRELIPYSTARFQIRDGGGIQQA